MYLVSIVNNEDVFGFECSVISGFKDLFQGIGIRFVIWKNQCSIVVIFFVRRDGDVFFVIKFVFMYGFCFVKGFQVFDYRWYFGSSENVDEYDGFEIENDDENRQYECLGEGYGFGYLICVVVGEVDINVGSFNECEIGIVFECDGLEVVNRVDDFLDGFDGDVIVDVVCKFVDVVVFFGCFVFFCYYFFFVEDRRCCRD